MQSSLTALATISILACTNASPAPIQNGAPAQDVGSINETTEIAVGRFHGATTLALETHIVFVDNVQLSWLEPASPTLLDHDEDSWQASRPVRLDALPNSIRSVLGTRVIGVSEKGTCNGTIGALTFVFGNSYRLGSAGLNETTATAEMTSYDWSHPTGNLVAQFQGECAMSPSAFLVGGPMPTDLIGWDETRLSADAIKRWRQSESWESEQAIFLENGNAGTWNASGSPVAMHLAGANNVGIVAVGQTVPNPGVRMDRDMVEIYAIRAGKLAERILLDLDTTQDIIASADLNRDGLPELITLATNGFCIHTSSGGSYETSCGTSDVGGY